MLLLLPRPDFSARLRRILRVRISAPPNKLSIPQASWLDLRVETGRAELSADEFTGELAGLPNATGEDLRVIPRFVAEGLRPGQREDPPGVRRSSPNEAESRLGDGDRGLEQ